MFSTVLVLNQ